MPPPSSSCMEFIHVNLLWILHCCDRYVQSSPKWVSRLMTLGGWSWFVECGCFVFVCVCSLHGDGECTVMVNFKLQVRHAMKPRKWEAGLMFLSRAMVSLTQGTWNKSLYLLTCKMAYHKSHSCYCCWDVGPCLWTILLLQVHLKYVMNFYIFNFADQIHIVQYCSSPLYKMGLRPQYLHYEKPQYTSISSHIVLYPQNHFVS